MCSPRRSVMTSSTTSSIVSSLSDAFSEPSHHLPTTAFCVLAPSAADSFPSTSAILLPLRDADEEPSRDAWGHPVLLSDHDTLDLSSSSGHEAELPQQLAQHRSVSVSCASDSGGSGSRSLAARQTAKRRKTWREQSAARRQAHAVTDARRRVAIAGLHSALAGAITARTGAIALSTEQTLEQTIRVVEQAGRDEQQLGSALIPLSLQRSSSLCWPCRRPP